MKYSSEARFPSICRLTKAGKFWTSKITGGWEFARHSHPRSSSWELNNILKVVLENQMWCSISLRLTETSPRWVWICEQDCTLFGPETWDFNFAFEVFKLGEISFFTQGVRKISPQPAFFFMPNQAVSSLRAQIRLFSSYLVKLIAFMGAQFVWRCE